MKLKNFLRNRLACDCDKSVVFDFLGLFQNEKIELRLFRTFKGHIE